MRVRELIEKLQDCPPDAHVSLSNIYDPENDYEVDASIVGIVDFQTTIDEIVLDWEYDYV